MPSRLERRNGADPVCPQIKCFIEFFCLYLHGDPAIMLPFVWEVDSSVSGEFVPLDQCGY